MLKKSIIIAAGIAASTVTSVHAERIQINTSTDPMTQKTETSIVMTSLYDQDDKLVVECDGVDGMVNMYLKWSGNSGRENVIGTGDKIKAKFDREPEIKSMLMDDLETDVMLKKMASSLRLLLQQDNDLLGFGTYTFNIPLDEFDAALPVLLATCKPRS